MPRYRSDGLTREQRAARISTRNVNQIRPGYWKVLASGGGQYYDIRRVRYHCLQPLCAAGGENQHLCAHRYTCSCPDLTNPCKHIYLVESVDTDIYPARPTAEALGKLAACRRAATEFLLDIVDATLQDPEMGEYEAGDLEQHLSDLVQAAARRGRVRAPARPDPVESASSEDEWANDDEDGDEDEEEDEDDDDDFYDRRHYGRRSPRIRIVVQRGFRVDVATRRLRGLQVLPETSVRPLDDEESDADEERARWEVDDGYDDIGERRTVTVARRRYRCKRRACANQRPQPCRHRYSCSCKDQCRHPGGKHLDKDCWCPDRTFPCEHVFRVHSLDLGSVPPPPSREEQRAAASARCASARSQVAALRPLLVTYDDDPLAMAGVEMAVWRAARYAVTALGQAVPEKPTAVDIGDGAPPKVEPDDASEMGDDDRLPPSSYKSRDWVKLSRRQCAALIPREAVRLARAADGRMSWTVECRRRRPGAGAGAGGGAAPKVAKVVLCKPVCRLRRCAAVTLCRHRYRCDCYDQRNPCKHIYRVHSLYPVVGLSQRDPVEADRVQVDASLAQSRALLTYLSGLLSETAPTSSATGAGAGGVPNVDRASTALLGIASAPGSSSSSSSSTAGFSGPTKRPSALKLEPEPLKKVFKIEPGCEVKVKAEPVAVKVEPGVETRAVKVEPQPTITIKAEPMSEGEDRIFMVAAAGQPVSEEIARAVATSFAQGVVHVPNPTEGARVVAGNGILAMQQAEPSAQPRPAASLRAAQALDLERQLHALVAKTARLLGVGFPVRRPEAGSDSDDE